MFVKLLIILFYLNLTNCSSMQSKFLLDLQSNMIEVPVNSEQKPLKKQRKKKTTVTKVKNKEASVFKSYFEYQKLETKLTPLKKAQR